MSRDFGKLDYELRFWEVGLWFEILWAQITRWDFSWDSTIKLLHAKDHSANCRSWFLGSFSLVNLHQMREKSFNVPHKTSSVPATGTLVGKPKCTDYRCVCINHLYLQILDWFYVFFLLLRTNFFSTQKHSWLILSWVVKI